MIYPYKKGALMAMLFILLGLAGPANAATLTVGTVSGQVGDTIEVPVELTDLGGDAVWSIEIDVSWYANRAVCVGVVTAGTLSQSWLVNFLPGSSTVTVSTAGGTPLAGDGTLFKLQLLLGPVSGGSPLTLTAAVMNEGDPVPVRVNGYLTVSALPTINVSPDVGLLAVGQTLAFATTGGSAPFTYTSSNPAVADFSGGNLLTAMTPGLVQVQSMDDNGLTDTTTGTIEVRAFTLDVGESSGTAGDVIWVPVVLGDPGPFGIVSGEFLVGWYGPYADFVGVETAGTLMGNAGWNVLTHEPSAGSLTVVGSGSSTLAGPGTLCYLKFLGSNSTSLSVSPGTFNEIYPAVPLSGYLTVTALPVITVNPSTANLVVGNTQQFTIGGSPTPPFTWSVDDPAVATIGASGLLTAVSEGDVVVHVLDSGGSEAWSGVISVCGLALPALVSSIDALETVLVPVWLDRDVDGLDLYSYELTVNYNPAYVEFLGAVEAGTLSNPWGAALAVDNATSVSVFHAGSIPLAGCGPVLVYLEFRGLPGLGSPYTGVSLQGVLFNEGVPCARINTGVPCDASGVDDLPVAGLRLWPNHPNPFNPRTTIDFTVGTSGLVRLSVYSVRGVRVRKLVAGDFAAGQLHSVQWDGRNDAGLAVASGVYYYRLESPGGVRMNKMLLLK